jgi:hypothetical protein
MLQSVGKCTIISSGTIEAYNNALYKVFIPSEELPLVLEINTFSPVLRALLIKYKVDCASFITACNPHSVIATEEANRMQQKKLHEELCEMGYVILNASGMNVEETWIEESFFVLGLAKIDAIDIASKYHQNAIVWSDFNAFPQLVLLR